MDENFAGACRGHGADHILTVAFGNLRQHPAIDGGDAIEGLARGGGHVFAVDEGLVAIAEGGDHGAVVDGHGALRNGGQKCERHRP